MTRLFDILASLIALISRAFDYFAARKSSNVSSEQVKEIHSKDPTDSAFDKDMWRD